MRSPNKTETLRNQIRRKHIDDIFAHERNMFLQRIITREHQQLGQTLKTDQNKQQWIFKAAEKLKSSATEECRELLRHLSISTRYYEQYFYLWIKSGVISYLIGLLTRSEDDSLRQMAAIILGQIFYYLPEESQIIDTILEYEFILQLSELCSPSVKDASQYYQLIIEMISHRPYIRDKFIDNGIVQNLVVRLKQKRQFESDETFKGFSLVLRLLKIYEKNNYKMYPKRTVCSIFMPTLQLYLVSTQRYDTVEIILKCILQLAELNTEAVFRLIIDLPYLLKGVLNYLCLKSQPTIRKLCAGILTNFLCSQNISHAKQLLYMGFLDRMNQCIQIQQENNIGNTYNSKSISMVTTILMALQNFAANNEETSMALINHPVFQFVISMTHESIPQKIRFEGVYTLGTIISTKQYQLIQKLVNQYKILEIYVLNLNTPSYSFACEILNNLILLVSFYQNVFTGKVNKVTDILERFYNIENKLKELEDSCPDPKIQRKIQLLYAKLNGQ